MNRIKTAIFSFFLLIAQGCWAQLTTDVCVYGATPAGIMAACAAKSEGKNVILIEPGRRIGGVTAGGLGWTDLYHPEILKGYARQFYERVAAYYGETGLKLTFEPKVALGIFHRFLSDSGVDDVLMEHRITDVQKDGNRITAITLTPSPKHPNDQTTKHPNDQTTKHPNYRSPIECYLWRNRQRRTVTREASVS